MIFKFTLTHATGGSKVISEPDGWEKSTLGFERHPDFHSLVEFFKSTFQAYGSNGIEDGGRDWLLNIEKTYGEDADLDILVEIDYDETGAFETLYAGQVAVGMFVETLDTDHMLQMVFTQSGFWTKFISRFQNKVNIKSTASESGVSVTAAPEIDLPLPSQIINQVYSAYNATFLLFFDGAEFNTSNFIQAGFDTTELDEINEHRNSPAILTANVTPKFIVEYAGDYVFNIRIEASGRVNSPLNIVAGNAYVKWYIQKNDETPIAFTETNFGTGSYISTVYAYAATLTLDKNDSIKIYGDIIASITPLGTLPFYQIWGFDTASTPSGYGSGIASKPSFISITGKTVYDQTSTKSFLVHDVMAAITDRITDQPNLFYSEYLGNAFTSRVYGSQGCGSLMANAKGLHIRGYSLTEKSFFESAKEWWDGVNPIFNLGLGYEKKNGSDVIRVERKEYFYDDSGFSALLSNVQNIRRYYDTENQFNQVEIGYQKWESQASSGTGTPSGIDDPQTKRTYNSRFKRIGKKITLFSKWVAASLTLETTRRIGILKSANYTYDNETFVIALKSLGGGSFTPELNENFTTLTNLTNSATRYNSKLTPARNFLRWLNFLSGCLQSYLTSSFKFSSGEGNYTMTSQMSTTCDGDGTLISENGDIPVSTNFLFRPMPYEISHYLTWDQYKAIRDNKNKAIGISQTETGHKKFFIKSLSYEIGSGRVKIVAWPKEVFDIQAIDFVPEDPTVSRYYESNYESQYE